MKYIWRIIKFTSSLWRYYVVIGVVTIFVALMNLLQPLLSGWAIDEIRKGTSASVRYVVLIAVGIFIIDLLSNVFNNVGGYLGDLMSTKLQRDLSTKYYQHILSLPQQYFDQELGGKIINRLNRSIDQISGFMQMLSNNFLQFIFSTVFALIIIAYYSWPIALMLFSLYPIYIWMTVKTSKRWMSYAKKINNNWDIATGRFAEAIGQVRVVKSYTQEKRELSRFRRSYEKIVSYAKPQSQLWHKKDMQRRFILNVIFFGVYLLIFIESAKGVFTPGQAVALILYAMQIRIPIFTISYLVDNTQKAVANSKDYFEIMNIPPDILDHPNATELKVSDGNIVFDEISFSYNNDKLVLNKINIKIAPGSRVALVGESGEGKTTIVNLLMRLYEPKAGQILIDGQNILTVTQSSLRASIGVVFQDPSLFSGTIRDNITYASPRATKDQIELAAKAANAHEFISQLNNEYDTEIGERGIKLSGGQKQRIAIARALLKDAPILILDEATSSLDSKSETLVQQALNNLMKGRTTIIIAHRLSTIQSVDQIVTLKGGRINEVGTPKQLAKSGGIYAQLLALQGGKTTKDKNELRQYEIAQ